MPIMAQNMDTPHPRNLIPCHPTDWWMMAPLFRLSNAGAPHPKCINKFNSNVSFKKYSLGKLMLVNHCEIELLLLTHPFNSLFSWTTWLRQHQKDKPFWILMVQEMIGWQWHQLDHMQIICTLLEREITMPVSHHLVFTGRMPFLPSNQQCQGTEGVPLLNRNTTQTET